MLQLLPPSHKVICHWKSVKRCTQGVHTQGVHTQGVHTQGIHTQGVHTQGVHTFFPC